MAYLPPDTPGLERLYRFDDSTTEVADRTGNSAPVPLATDVTITASDAPTALDPAPPVVPGPNAEVTAFVYDPWAPYSTVANDVILDFENGVAVRRWLHGTTVDEPLALETYTGTTAPGSGSAFSLFGDRLGSVLSVVEDATQTVAAQYDYDSFGRRTATGAFDQRYGFTGREVDGESGLIYFRARAYDPALGQFVQRDPIGFRAGDLNLYAYAWNDPFNWTDPSGLSVDCASGPACKSLAPGVIAAVGRATLGLAGAIAMYLTGDWFLNASNNADDPPGPGSNGPGDGNSGPGDGNSGNSTGNAGNPPPQIGGNGGPPLGPEPPNLETLIMTTLGIGAVEFLPEFGYDFTIPGQNGPINITTQMRVEGDTLYMEDFQIFSGGTGSSSAADLRQLATQFGRNAGVSKVVVRGYRVGGANPGREVSFTFNVQ